MGILFLAELVFLVVFGLAISTLPGFFILLVSAYQPFHPAYSKAQTLHHKLQTTNYTPQTARCVIDRHTSQHTTHLQHLTSRHTVNCVLDKHTVQYKLCSVPTLRLKWQNLPRQYMPSLVCPGLQDLNHFCGHHRQP